MRSELPQQQPPQATNDGPSIASPTVRQVVIGNLLSANQSKSHATASGLQMRRDTIVPPDGSPCFVGFIGPIAGFRAVKSYRKELWFEIANRRGFANITPQVAEAVRASGVREGLCLVNAMHISASVFINDDERGLHSDLERWLEGLAPHEPVSQYRHNDTGEDNADAHLKRTIMGREVVIAITAGELDFGPWEQVFYGEFDGRRRKRVLVKIIGE